MEVFSNDVFFSSRHCSPDIAAALRLTCRHFAHSTKLRLALLRGHPYFAAWFAVPDGHSSRLPMLCSEDDWKRAVEEMNALRVAFRNRVHLHDFAMMEEDEGGGAVVLGNGPMSTVELARHVATGCFVALKSYSKHIVAKNDKVQEVMAEKRALEALDYHPLVLRLFATFQTDKLLFFVLELCPGGDLVDVVRRHPDGRLPVESGCWPILKQLVDVLSYIHAKGIMHRDVRLFKFGCCVR